jgi:pyruvate dehydrogenase E2 component (dihydrolipoamide acetyltransferase)
VAEFVMPSLGADMTAGTLAKWRVRVGDAVKHGDIVAEVETDKGIIEVEVFQDGVIQELLVQEGQKVPVGTPLAEIGARTASVPAAQTAAESVAVTETVPETAPVPRRAPESVSVTASRTATASAPAREPAPVKPPAPLASPAVRRRAHELDVPLEGLRGTGEHGRITLQDVEGAARGTPPPPTWTSRTWIRISPYARRLASERGVDLGEIRGSGPAGAIVAEDVLGATPSKPESVSVADRMQRVIAAAMSRANQEIPHYYVEQTIDMHEALAWLRQTNASASIDERLVPGVLVLRAVALALRKHKAFNATWENRTAVEREEIHVGLAVSLRKGGLVAPALRHTDQGSLWELMARMTDLVGRARTGVLRSSEMASATITFTALGERGVESVTPIIFPPQVAIVGCGTIVERPWVVDGQVVTRPVMHVTLGADHRVSNGHQGARFLSTLETLLQEPAKL